MQSIENALITLGGASLVANHRLKWAITHSDSEQVNPSGEKSSTLDLEINELFIENLANANWCAAVASEELDTFKNLNNDASLIVILDPLDGSENAKVNNTVGTIFGIFRKINKTVSEKDFLQPAKDLVAAGYIVYGSQPTMVVAYDGLVTRVNITSSEAFGDPIVCPHEGKIVALNSGNYPHWDKLSKDWFDTVVEYGKSSFRYSGCMVADFHRILLQGGIFAYPTDRKNKNGKLRLLFECAPLAYIMHMAGGTSTTGEHISKNILDIVPTSLHQTTPVFLGSKNNIEDYFRG